MVDLKIIYDIHIEDRIKGYEKLFGKPISKEDYIEMYDDTYDNFYKSKDHVVIKEYINSIHLRLRGLKIEKIRNARKEKNV